MESDILIRKKPNIRVYIQTVYEILIFNFFTEYKIEDTTCFLPFFVFLIR